MVTGCSLWRERGIYIEGLRNVSERSIIFKFLKIFMLNFSQRSPRKNEVAPTSSSGAPPEKKQSLDIDVSTSNSLTVSNSSPVGVKTVDKAPAVRRIIKLKRPTTRTAPATK